MGHGVEAAAPIIQKRMAVKKEKCLTSGAGKAEHGVVSMNFRVRHVAGLQI